MILNLLATPLLGLLSLFLSLFPTADPAKVSQLTSQLTAFRSSLAAMDWILPVGTFFTFLGLVFLIETSYFTYRFFKWVISTLSIGLLK